MVSTTGVTGAAPIWSQFMQTAVPYVTHGNPNPFTRPTGIVGKVICSLSGTEPSKWCKGGQRNEIFANDQLPLPASQDLRRQVTLDTWTGLEASTACNDFTEDQTVINVSDPWAQKWFDTKDGRNWLRDNGFSVPPAYAPGRECRDNDSHPTLDLNVNEGAVISNSTLAIKGTADATGGFRSWQLEFGFGNNPNNWTTLSQGNQPVRNDFFINWDMSNIPNGTIALHLYVTGANGYAERFVHFTLQVPTPIPPPTLTPSPTPTDTPVPTVAPTETPTLTPFPTDTPTP
jgi:hypothetical protein